MSRPPLAGVSRRTRELAPADAPTGDALLRSPGPVVVKRLAADWPLVRAGMQGAAAAADYLANFDAGRPVVAYLGAAGGGGRYFYDADLTGFNFTRERAPLGGHLRRLVAQADDPDAPFLYVGSTDLQAFLPGFAGENPPPVAAGLLAAHPPLASLWVGNRTVAPAHWDMSNNIAVCAVGRRRFTLFPPDQAANLYPGPLEPTPGGRW